MGIENYNARIENFDWSSRDHPCLRKRVAIALLVEAMAGVLFLVLQPSISPVD
jgi:hypothetical protein